jgi:hypothetical protein
MKPTLAEDIEVAIYCLQDYKDTIDLITDQKLYDIINARIERLFSFYYQLIGFDPYEGNK